MIRGTTPTFSLRIKGDTALDLTRASTVYVTIRQRGIEIEISGDDLTVERQVVHCFLAQEPSLQLMKGDAEIQVNWTYTATGGVIRRNATAVKTIPIGKQLLERVIGNG